MQNPTPPEVELDANQSICSPLNRLNLVIICCVLMVYGILMLVEFMPGIIILLAASLLLTYLLLGPVSGMESLLARFSPKKWPISPSLKKILAILLVYLLFFSLLFLSLLRIAVPLSVQIKEFARDIPSRWVKVSTSSQPNTLPLLKKTWNEASTVQAGKAKIITENRITLVSPKPTNPKARILSASVSMALHKIAGASKSFAAKIGGYILDIGTHTLQGFIYTLTTLVLVFYLLHDGETLKKGLVNLTPTQYEPVAEQFLDQVHMQFYTLIKGQVLMSFLSGSLIYLLLLILGLKYALLLGVLYGAASILPVIGPWLGLIPITVIVAISDHPLNILPILLLAGSFYLIKAYWLWPKFISRTVNIHPLIFVLTFLACIKVVGFMGILLSFPLSSIFGVWVDFVQARHWKQSLHLTVGEGI